MPNNSTQFSGNVASVIATGIRAKRQKNPAVRQRLIGGTPAPALKTLGASINHAQTAQFAV
jgi:hypothetical protein